MLARALVAIAGQVTPSLAGKTEIMMKLITVSGMLITFILMLGACAIQPSRESVANPDNQSVSMPAPELVALPETTPTLHPKGARQIEIALATATAILPVCGHEILVHTEKEQTVIMNSFFDEDVRKSFAEDLHTQVNAAYLDLETGSVEKCETMDIYYQLSCGSQCSPLFHEPEGVRMVPFAEREPTLLECIAATDSGDSRNHLEIRYGFYTCVKTIEGRLGWIRYDDDFRQNLPSGEVQITYFLWKQAGDK